MSCTVVLALAVVNDEVLELRAAVLSVRTEFIAASDDARDDDCPPVVAMLMLNIISASSLPSFVARFSPRRPCAAANLADDTILEPSILTVAATVFGGAPPPPPPPPTATEVAVGETVVVVPDAEPPKAPAELVLDKLPVTVL